MHVRAAAFASQTVSANYGQLPSLGCIFRDSIRVGVVWIRHIESPSSRMRCNMKCCRAGPGSVSSMWGLWQQIPDQRSGVLHRSASGMTGMAKGSNRSKGATGSEAFSAIEVACAMLPNSPTPSSAPQRKTHRHGVCRVLAEASPPGSRIVQGLPGPLQ
jgi:hypothetical protein